MSRAHDDQTRVAIDRAKALVKLGREARAKKVLARALASDPDHAGALTELAYTHYLLDENDEALRLIDRALGLEVNSYRFRIRAMILKDMFRTDDAIDAVQSAIKLAPGVGGHHAALSGLLRCDRRAEASLIAAKRGVELNPSNVHCLDQLGRSALEVGDLELAARTVRRVLELDPDEPVYHVRLATVLDKANRHDEVIDVLRSALSRHPTALWVLGMLAIKLERAGARDEASKVEQAAERVAGRKFASWATLGGVAEHEGDRARALKFYGRANELNPIDPHAAAWFAEMLEDPARALEIIEPALLHNPAHQQLAHSKVSRLMQLGRFDDAIAAATAYFERTGDVMRLISALASAGRLDELARYEPVLETLPDGHDKFEEHGNIALARGDWALAESKFREVLADGSTCCCSWAGLGIALFELGRREESAACERSVTEHNWSCSCVTATSLRRRLG